MSARTHIQTEKELCAAARPPRRFFRQNAKTFLTFVLFSDKIHLACGGIAQLGERLNGIQEVSGSIPLISTTKNPASVRTQDFFFFPAVLKPPGCQQIISPGAASQRPAFCMPCLPPGFFTDAGQLSAKSCLWDLRCDMVKPQRKNRLRERGNDMFELFLVIVYYIVGLLRESYLEFVAAEYYCNQCR